MYGFYFSKDYIWFLLAIGIVALISAIASSKVKSTFKKYDKVLCRSGKSGAQIAGELLRYGGATGISIGRVAGELSDHYHPAKAIVNLSASTYDSKSVAAAAVAAHEIGHVMQKHNG